MTAAEVDQPNVLLAALRYASMGLRVLPIRPVSKAPMLNDWPTRATTDSDTIRGWWARAPQAGVGITMGWQPDGTTIICVDIDNHNPAELGADTIRDLEDAYGPLPDTWTAITWSGGQHQLFTVSNGLGIRNDAGKLLGPGVDIRGDGGQIVVDPTIHPCGRPYVWETAPWDRPIAPAPGWLIALLTVRDDEPVEPPREPYTGEERPGDRWAQTITWQELLQPDGANCLGTTRNGVTLWSRPGLEGNQRHTSATTGAVRNCLHVFTTGWPGLPPGNYTKLGYLAHTQHGGDHNAAARWLVTQGWGAPHDDADGIIGDTFTGTDGTSEPRPPPETGWDYEPLDQHVNGTYTRPQPTFLRRG
jgi:Bifunctional DNA primase/polymerase, N-terminal